LVPMLMMLVRQHVLTPVVKSRGKTPNRNTRCLSSSCTRRAEKLGSCDDASRLRQSTPVLVVGYEESESLPHLLRMRADYLLINPVERRAQPIANIRVRRGVCRQLERQC